MSELDGPWMDGVCVHGEGRIDVTRRLSKTTCQLVLYMNENSQPTAQSITTASKCYCIHNLNDLHCFNISFRQEIEFLTNTIRQTILVKGNHIEEVA